MADLNFFNLDDCTAISFDTPTTGLQYIEYVLGSVVKDFTNVDKYTITYSINCCSPGVATDIAPRYQFVLSESCLFGTPTPGFDSYAIQVDGINGNLVQSIELNVGGVPAAGWNYTVVSDVLSINDVQIAGAAVGAFNYELIITTTSGFVYTIDFIITKAGNECDGVFSGTTITYPSLPSNIVEVNDSVAAFITVAPSVGLTFTITADNSGTVGNGITITPDGILTLTQLVDAYNTANPSATVTLTGNSGAYVPAVIEGPYVLAGGVDYTYQRLSLNSLTNTATLLPGTYEVIFCETLYGGSSTCVQNHMFIDCGTLKCQVVNKLILCVDSNIMDYYNALIWANDCTDTVTYQEFCALYEILIIILETDGCYGKLDDCNCTDATTIANKLSPIQYPTQPTTNGCSSC